MTRVAGVSCSIWRQDRERRAAVSPSGATARSALTCGKHLLEIAARRAATPSDSRASTRPRSSEKTRMTEEEAFISKTTSSSCWPSSWTSTAWPRPRRCRPRTSRTSSATARASPASRSWGMGQEPHDPDYMAVGDPVDAVAGPLAAGLRAHRLQRHGQETALALRYALHPQAADRPPGRARLDAEHRPRAGVHAAGQKRRRHASARPTRPTRWTSPATTTRACRAAGRSSSSWSRRSRPSASTSTRSTTRTPTASSRSTSPTPTR